ncbi:MAG TPA: ATP-binding protein [Thermomicrobiales bacterium]
MAQPALLEVLHALLAQFWAALTGLALPLPDEQRHRFETAVIEIAGNVIRYAYAQGNPGPLEVVLHAYPEYVEAVFSDGGVRYEPHDVPAPAMPRIVAPGEGDEQTIAELPEGGFGLALVRRAVDRLEYERTPDGRNRWILISTIRT